MRSQEIKKSFKNNNQAKEEEGEKPNTTKSTRGQESIHSFQ